MSRPTLITISEHTPRLDALGDALSLKGIRALNSRAAARLFANVRRHLLEISKTRHTTALRLGAAPTGYFEKAYANSGHTSDEHGATVTVRAPGFRRVFGDVQITPVVAQALTIPIHALAYGKRVSQLRHEGVTIFRPKGANYLAKANKDGTITPLYILARSALVRQDRTLLPSDDEMREQVKKGYRNAIEAILKKANASSA